MKVIIDRFEANYAIVEINENQTIELPKILIPEAREGDIISIEILSSETEAKKKKIREKMDQIFED